MSENEFILNQKSMKKPTHTQSFLSMRRILTLASIFLVSFQLQAQVINYHCDCMMDDVYLHGTIDVTSSPDETWEICDVTNFFAAMGDVLPYPDETALVQVSPGEYQLAGYVMDGPVPTLRLKRIGPDGTTVTYEVPMLMGTCPRSTYTFDRCTDPGCEILCVDDAPLTLCINGDMAVSAPDDFIWTASPASGVWFTNQSTNCVDVDFSEAGTYDITVYGTDTRNGCQFEETYTFTVLDYEVSVAGPAMLCDASAAGPHTYTLNTGNTDDVGITWSCPTCTSIIQNPLNDYEATAVFPVGTANHTITVQGTSASGCTFDFDGYDYVVAVVNPFDASFLQADTYVCVNDETFYKLDNFSSGSSADWATGLTADAGNADAAYLPTIIPGGNLGEVTLDFSGAVAGDLFNLVVSGVFADSGCAFQTSSIQIEVGRDQSGSIACNNQVNLTMDLSCEVAFEPTMILQGFDLNNDAYDMTMTNTATGELLVDNMLNSSHIGLTFQVMVLQECGSNSCWGFVTIEDKTIPSLVPYCETKDIYALCTDLAISGNSIGFPTFFTNPDITVTYLGNDTWQLDGFDNCGLATLTYSDESDVDFCIDPLVVTRTWVATDQISGATSSCSTEINVIPSSANDILWPPHYDDIFADPLYPTLDPCDATLIKNADGTPHPSSTGYPIIPACGGNFRDASYEDVMIPVCGSAPNQSMKVLRTWSVYDECELEFVYYTQIINMMDNQGPICYNTLDGQVFVDIHECVITDLEFPIPTFEDNCTATEDINYQIGYKTRDAVTGIIDATFTYLTANTNVAREVIADSDFIWVHYLAWDECGNQLLGSTGLPSDRGCFIELEIIDITEPTPVCDTYSTLSLNENGCGFAKPQTFDDSSHDNCSIFQKVIKRMDSATNPCNCEDSYPKYDFMEYLGAYTAADGSNHHYYLSNDVTRAHHAHAYAAALDESLAIVESVGEQTWIQDQVRLLTNDIYFIGLSAPYTGVATVNSDFVWANGATSTFRNWVGGSLGSLTVGPEYFVYADVNGEWVTTDSHNEFSPDGRYVVEVEDNCGWTQELKFCCADLLAGSVMVQMRAIDNHGNHNFCMVEVAIEDHKAPTVSAPIDRTLHCEDNLTDLSIYGTLTVADAAEECMLDTMYTEEPVSLDECGNGSIDRTWKVTDAGGNSVEVTQTLTIRNNDLFDGDTDVNWPDHIVLNDGRCSIADILPGSLPSSSGDPVVTRGDHCANVTWAYDDLVYYTVDDACMKVVRTWTIIDWCQNGRSWTYEQVIKLTDNVLPVLAAENCSSGLVIDGQASGPNCTIAGSVTASATDNCTAVEELTYWYTLTPEGGSGINGLGDTVDGPFPLGTHTIKWYVEDHCGNIGECVQTFTVRDTKPPIAYCRDLVVTSLDAEDENAVIWASDLVVPSNDYCDGNLSYSFSQDINDTNIEFACRHIENGVVDTIFLDVYFTDVSGNFTTCNVGVILQDNNDVCPDAFTIGSKGSIAGKVYTEMHEMIEDVNVSIYSTAPEFPLFENTMKGEYAFSDIDMYNDYTLEAVKDIEYLNGVSTLDIVLIQKHILGLQQLDSPYKIIAADVNNSQSVSSIDLIELRKLILGIYHELPNNDSWRFVEEEFNFLDPQNPWPHDEIIFIGDIAADMIDADFIGVKVGDVNQSVNLSQVGTSSSLESRSSEFFDMSIKQYSDLQANSARIDFVAESNTELLGSQFSLKFNTEDIEIVDFVEGAWNISANNTNLQQLENGVLAISWNDSRTVSVVEGDVLFSLEVNYMNANKASFTLIEQPVIAEVYEESNGQINILDLRFNDSEFSAEGFEVFQNVPNPFSDETTIGFKIGTKEEVLLQVSDYTGKVIYAESRVCDNGYHEFKIGKNILNTAGMLFYQISTKTQTITKKMVVLK